MTKIKDLDPTTNLRGIKVKTPNGEEGYWRSQWYKGVWLSNNKEGNGKITPIFVESLNECMEWEVIDESNSNMV